MSSCTDLLGAGPDGPGASESLRKSEEQTAGDMLELHVPTLAFVLNLAKRSMSEGRRMGLQVGTLREVVDDLERLHAAAPAKAEGRT